jgi:putative aminopeptidase FrvX
MTNIEKLLIELVKINSVSGSEKEILDVISKKLQLISGVVVFKQKVDGDRYNIIAKKVIQKNG